MMTDRSACIMAALTLVAGLSLTPAAAAPHDQAKDKAPTVAGTWNMTLQEPSLIGAGAEAGRQEGHRHDS